MLDTEGHPIPTVRACLGELGSRLHWCVDEVLVQVDLYALRYECSCRQEGPPLRVMAVIVSNDYSTLGCTFDIRQDVSTQSL
jgi:hypothetical protein